MRRKAPALLILVMMISCPLFLAAAEEGRTPNENGEMYVAISGSAFSTTPLHIGDQNVSLSVTVRNLCSSDGNDSNGDERLYTATLEVLGVENSAGQLLQPPASPLVWDVSSIDNDGNGYTLGYAGEGNSSYVFSGLQFDVKGLGARPGMYNLSIRVHYVTMVSWNTLEGPSWSAPLSEDNDNVRFEVASNVAVGTPVAYTDALASMPLYAGTGFQMIGISVRTLSGPLSNVSGTLLVPAASGFQPVISVGTSPAATVSRITATSTLYFRIDVPLTEPGIYTPSNANITLTLHYIRENNWNGRTENVAIGEDGFPLTFTVEYTPMLNATSASPAQLTRGTELGVVSVDLRNEGNADLVRLNVMLQADADFSPADYHYDGNGIRVPGPAQYELDTLRRGENATAVFHLAVYPNVPPGFHRLEVSYSGYFYNAGKTGASSSYNLVTDALFQQLRGQQPYIEIEVVSQEAALVLVSSPSPSSALNHGGETEGLNIGLRVRNDESYDFLNARFTVLAGDGTPVRNPTDGTARGLEPVILPRLAAGREASIEFESSLNTSLQPGLHQLTLKFQATSSDSGSELSSELSFFIRIGPFGPNLQIDSSSSAQLGAKTRDVVIPVTVQNSGSAALNGVRVRLGCGPGTPIIDPSSPSAISMVKDIGALGPGGTAQADFNVDIDGAAEARVHTLGVEVTGSYSSSGEPFTRADNITFRVLSAPPLLVILNLTAGPAEIIPGKGFTLAFTVRNVGGDSAKDVWLGLVGLAGTAAVNLSQTAGPTGLPGEVPFSADIAVRFIGDLGPGQEASVSFNMLSDTSAGRGRTYQQPLQLWYQDQGANTQYQQFALAVRTKAASPPAEPAKDWTPILLLVGFMIIVIVVAVAILAPRRVKRSPAEPEPEKQTPAEPAPPAEASSQVAVAVPMQPPPPPPGYSGAVAQSHQLPPPPPPAAQGAATAMRVEGGTAPGRAGPLEGYAIPGAEADQPKYSAPPQKPKSYSGKEVPMRTCPTCGNEVKVRFVKCPYCGSDLPPMS
jgi:hypothetical protein